MMPAKQPIHLLTQRTGKNWLLLTTRTTSVVALVSRQARTLGTANAALLGLHFGILIQTGDRAIRITGWHYPNQRMARFMGLLIY
jgi:hypothetical protein